MDREPTHTEAAKAVVAAVRAVDDAAPPALRDAITRMADAAERGRGRRRMPTAPRPRALAFGGGMLALAVVLVVALAGGDGSAPTVRDAARAALRTATAAAPAARPGGHALVAAVEGIAYPTWRRAGWHAVGERTDTLAGHRVRTVFYADAQGARIGYAIASGGVLSVSGGRGVERHGAHVRVLRLDGASVVTWRRDGHTCVLAGRGVAAARLVTLASYAS